MIYQASMMYHAYELTHTAVSPLRSAARLSRGVLVDPLNPLKETYAARTSAALCEMFISATRRYAKPDWGVSETAIDGRAVAVKVEVVRSLPFCDLVHFRRDPAAIRHRDDPPVLMIAPMSGHYATLLRGTVEAMLPEHEVYVTDWADARDMPLTAGRFDLDDFADYLIAFCRFIAAAGERPAVMAVCQPGVPMMVAAALMAMEDDPARPASLTLMGSPIDTASRPKRPSELARMRPLSWFESNVIVYVPWPNRGFMRRVYPGFLQLTGFMTMNLDRHIGAQLRHFRNLVRGDGDGARAHRRFYDEFLSVMDLSADYYLQTIDRVFQRQLLPRGTYRHRERRIDTTAIRDIALLTVEGERDDITGPGQTIVAHGLVPRLPAAKRAHHTQSKVGHYGVFNGSRWRSEVQPRVRDFIRNHRAAVR